MNTDVQIIIQDNPSTSQNEITNFGDRVDDTSQQKEINKKLEYRIFDTSQTVNHRYSINEYIESSTSKVTNLIKLNLAREDIRRVLNYLSSDLYDEIGKDELTSMLKTIIVENGILVLNIIYIMIEINQIKGLEITQLLKSIGDIKHPESHSDRLLFLERMLFNGSPRIRDGASLGLSLMDDPHSIHYLQMAISCENIDELKKNFQKVIRQLDR